MNYCCLPVGLVSVLVALSLPTEAASVVTDARAITAALGMTTSLRAGYWRSTRLVDDQQNLVPISVWVREQYRLGSDIALFAEGWIQSADASRAAEPAGELRETYLRGAVKGFDVRIGRQIAAWGRADGINPTDNLTARNLSWLFADDEDLRRGSAMLRAQHPIGESFELAVYWIPEFRPEVRPLAAHIGPFVMGGDRRPVDLGQGAIRLDANLPGVDWSLSYFEGRDPIGDVHAFDAAGQPFTLLREYARERTVGGDLALVRWGLNLRGEVAYTDFPDRTTGDLSKRPFLLAVVGGDRTFAQRFNLNLQYIFRHTDYHGPETERDPRLRAIALINAIEAGQRDDYQNGATLRLGWTTDDELLRAELFAIEDFTHGDGLLKTKLSYQWTDAARVTVGYTWDHGASDTLFGSRHRNSGVFLELRQGY